MIVVCKQTPNLARVLFDGSAINAGHTQILQRDPLRMEHPEHIMIGGDEQLGRVGEGFVFGKPARVGMAVGADDGQIAHLIIKRARQFS